MFENKLTLKQALQIFGILQIPLGIVGYFNIGSKIRFIYLTVMVIFGFLAFASSFSKKVSTSRTVKKEEMNSSQKWEQIMGAIFICIGLLPFILLYPDMIYTVSFIDLGIFSLIMPPIHTTKKG